MVRAWLVASLVLAAACASDPVIELPKDTPSDNAAGSSYESDDSEDSPLKNLDADSDFRQMQSTLKEAQGVQDTDDDGLAEAQQMAQIQAYNIKQGMNHKLTNHDLGESVQFVMPKKVSPSVDQLMGKMVMADMFDDDELDHVKKALVLMDQGAKKKKDLGESPNLVKAGRAMAIGLKQNIKELKGEKQKVKDEKKKLAEMSSEVDSLKSEKSQETDMLQTEQNKMQHKVRSLHSKYRKDLDNMAQRLQTASTQNLLSKRALQICEAKSKGSEGRALERVARRTDRAVDHATKMMNRAEDRKEMKKGLEAKIEKKLKAKFKQTVKKMAQKSKKHTSKLCIACAKLTKAEYSQLNVDCTACA